MKKLLFLKNDELNKLINEELKEDGVRYLLSVNEQSSEDILLKTKSGLTDDEVFDFIEKGVEAENDIEVLSFKKVFDCVNNKYNVKVTSHDVYEVGDFGEGFAFEIE